MATSRLTPALVMIVLLGSTAGVLVGRSAPPSFGPISAGGLASAEVSCSDPGSSKDDVADAPGGCGASVERKRVPDAESFSVQIGDACGPTIVEADADFHGEPGNVPLDVPSPVCPDLGGPFEALEDVATVGDGEPSCDASVLTSSETPAEGPSFHDPSSASLCGAVASVEAMPLLADLAEGSGDPGPTDASGPSVISPSGVTATSVIVQASVDPPAPDPDADKPRAPIKSISTRVRGPVQIQIEYGDDAKAWAPSTTRRPDTPVDTPAPARGSSVGDTSPPVHAGPTNPHPENVHDPRWSPQGSSVPPQALAVRTASLGPRPLPTGTASTVACLAIVLILGAALYHRITRERVTLHPRRQQIQRIVAETQGLTVTELARRLDLHPTTVKRHLDRLTDAEVIARRVVLGGRARYYLPGAQGPESLVLLRVPLARALLSIVAARPGITIGEAAATLSTTRFAVRTQIVRLAAASLLCVRSDGPMRRLYPMPSDPRTLSGM